MVKKSIMMTVAVGSAALTFNVADADTIKTGTVTASALNIRSGAGTNNSIVGKTYRGSSVQILESANGWHKVKTSNGTTGWASGQYININESSNSGSNNSGSAVNKSGKVTASALNIRSGAGTNYSIVGKTYNGNTVEVLESTNGWYKIKTSNGTTGWASAQYITLSSTPDNSGSTTPEDNTSGSAVNQPGTVTASTLNVRSGAGTNYSVVTKVYKGNSVNVLESANGWYKIKTSNGTTGWASAQYITLGSAPSQPDNSGSSNDSSNNPSASNKQEAIVNLAKQQLGKAYVWGSEGPDTFDCSGLTYYVYKNAAGVSLPRTSTAQSNVGTTINRSDLQPGDLLFSSTNGSGSVSHVGIYIGNGQMIHSPKAGDVVKITNINTSYWNNAYLWAKRVI